jgi:hypothetical protein
MIKHANKAIPIRKSKYIILIVFLLSIMFLPGCVHYQKYAENNGLIYYVHPLKNTCFVSGWVWDGDEKNTIVTIPDTYRGKRVTQLSGHIGHGGGLRFELRPPDSFYDVTVSYGCPMESPYSISELDFTLNIGKNITEYPIWSAQCYYKKTGEDGENNIYYHVYTYVNCSEENPTFYSKDGRLYYRENDELVNAFNYR